MGNLWKYINLVFKSWAYAKFCQKTGMSPVEVDLWKDSVKAGGNILGKKLNLYLRDKGIIKPRKSKAKVLPIHNSNPTIKSPITYSSGLRI